MPQFTEPGLVLLTAPTYVFTHLVTLINHATGDERMIRVETLSDTFSDVLREVLRQKALLGLKGYEVWEAMSCTDAF